MVMHDNPFKAYDRAQLYVLPPSLDEWLPPGHLAYFILDVIDRLDLSAGTAHAATVGPDGCECVEAMR